MCDALQGFQVPPSPCCVCGGLQVFLKAFPEEGRGLTAASLIRKGSRLLQLPESVLLTAEVAARGGRRGRGLGMGGEV